MSPRQAKIKANDLTTVPFEELPGVIEKLYALTAINKMAAYGLTLHQLHRLVTASARKDNDA